MGPGYFVIAILGCADSGSACTPVATLPTHYATVDACSAATGAALIEHNEFDFPTLVARCRPSAAKTSAEAETNVRPPAGSRRG